MTVFAKPPTGDWKDGAPIWVKERRRPTRAELAAKHFSDGGGMGTAAPTAQDSSFFDTDEEMPHGQMPASAQGYRTK